MTERLKVVLVFWHAPYVKILNGNSLVWIHKAEKIPHVKSHIFYGHRGRLDADNCCLRNIKGDSIVQKRISKHWLDSM